MACPELSYGPHTKMFPFLRYKSFHPSPAVGFYFVNTLPRSEAVVGFHFVPSERFDLVFG